MSFVQTTKAICSKVQKTYPSTSSFVKFAYKKNERNIVELYIPNQGFDLKGLKEFVSDLQEVINVIEDQLEQEPKWVEKK